MTDGTPILVSLGRVAVRPRQDRMEGVRYPWELGTGHLEPADSRIGHLHRGQN
jgi:hypothetical protein